MSDLEMSDLDRLVKWLERQSSELYPVPPVSLEDGCRLAGVISWRLSMPKQITTVFVVTAGNPDWDLFLRIGTSDTEDSVRSFIVQRHGGEQLLAAVRVDDPTIEGIARTILHAVTLARVSGKPTRHD